MSTTSYLKQHIIKCKLNPENNPNANKIQCEYCKKYYSNKTSIFSHLKYCNRLYLQFLSKEELIKIIVENNINIKMDRHKYESNVKKLYLSNLSVKIHDQYNKNILNELSYYRKKTNNTNRCIFPTPSS